MNAEVVVEISMVHMQKLCVPTDVKGITVKVFNLMSRTIETKYIGWHKTCSWRCTLSARACDNKQIWKKDKGGCECKELIVIRVGVIKDLFGTLVIVIVNVINHVLLENI